MKEGWTAVNVVHVDMVALVLQPVIVQEIQYHWMCQPKVEAGMSLSLPVYSFQFHT